MPPRPSCAGSSATMTTSPCAARIGARWSAGSATSSARASRSPDILALAAEGQQRAAAQGRTSTRTPTTGAFARQDADYLDGVMATLAWVLGERAEAPITRAHSRELTTRDLKVERVHAEDVIEQSRNPWMADRLPPLWYGEGVKFSITWLLGDSTAPPVDPAGRGPYGQDSELPAILRKAQTRQHHL